MLNRRSRGTCNSSASALAGLDADGGAGRESCDSSAEVVGAAYDERVGVVEDVERIRTEFQVIPFGDEELLVNAKVEVPSARSTECIPSKHVRRIRSKFRVSSNGVGE